MSLIIKQDFLPRGTPPRPGILLSHPTSVTIHWIGPYPGQVPQDSINWWKDREASAHFLIKDTVVVNAIPIGEVAWHCGSKGNYTSIGIECFPMNIKGEFSADTIASLAEVLKQFPGLELLRHYDWTKKDCPLYYTPLSEGGQERWEALKKELRNEC